MARVTAKESLDKLNFQPGVEGTREREVQLLELLYVFNGFDSKDLADFSFKLKSELQASDMSDAEKKNIEANFGALTNYINAEEQLERENKVKPEVDRAASLNNVQRVDIERARNVANHLVSNKSIVAYAFKLAVAKIQDVVAQAKENIDMKVEEVKEKSKERKIEREVKKFEKGGSLLERLAQKAKDKIFELGEKAMEKIMKLSNKNKGGDVEMQISSPEDFRHVAGEAKNKAALAAKAALYTGHADLESQLRAAEVKPDEIKTVDFAGLEQAELDELLKDVKSSGSAVSQEELDALLAEDPNSQAEAVVEQLQQDVSEVESSFSKMATGINELAKSAPTADELAVQKEADQMMDALDAVLKAMDDYGPEKNTSKTAEPGAPRSGSDSGPSTPRAGH